MSIFNRLKLIRSVVALGMLLSLLSSYNLWAGQRWFPTCPLIELFYLSPPYDYIVLSSEVVLLLFLIMGIRTKLVIFLVLALNVVYILLDQNRLQPWFFIYNSFLFVLFFYNWRLDNVNTYNSFFIILQLCFSAVYVYSGLQKFNPAFINETYPVFIKPLHAFFSERQMLTMNKTGYVIPVYELVMGFLLLIRSFRFIAIPMVLILHVSIVFLTGPMSNDYNSSVWIWNLVMIFLALLLFSGKTTERYFSISNLFQMPVFYFVVVLFWLLPAFNLFNKWETYLSFSMYSGNNHDGKIVLTEAAYMRLPLYVKYYAVKDNNQYVLPPKEWCLQELNTSMYPEKRVFEHVTAQLVKLTQTSVNDVKLVYIERQKMFEARP